MSHKRTDIRNAVVTMLTNGSTSAGSHIYASRVLDLWPDELPAIFVYSKQESSERLTVSSSRLRRHLDLTIDVHVKATSALETALDDICLQIENLISADTSLSGTASDAVLTSTTLNLSGEGEALTGVASLTYQVLYTS